MVCGKCAERVIGAVVAVAGVASWAVGFGAVPGVILMVAGACSVVIGMENVTTADIW